MGRGMESLEAQTHSFVGKLWLEEIDEEIGWIVWCGQITHVESGESRYLKDLGEIANFIVPYLERMGVKLRLRWPISQWRWKS